MVTTWFSIETSEGLATIYDTNITLNVVAMAQLGDAYGVKVGYDDNDSVVIMPLSKADVLRGDIDAKSIFLIKAHSSYMRISSSLLVKMIAEHSHLSFSKTPQRFKTEYDGDAKILRIILKERRD